MLAFEPTGEFHHTVFVQRVWIMMHIRPLERATYFAAHNAVFVSLSPGIKARMKFGIYLFSREYADGGRQQPVHGAAQVGQRNGIRDGERRHLRERVHPGVGAPRSGDVHRFAFHTGNDLLQRPLYGGQTGLHLPAVKRASVVGQRNPDAAQCGATRGASPVSPPETERAQRAFFRVMGGHLHRHQCGPAHADVGLAAAAVDDGARLRAR